MEDYTKLELRSCSTCGGSYVEIYEDSPDRCRCRRAAGKATALLKELDPTDSMTLSKLDAEHPSLKKARHIAESIVCGDRKRGLFMLGEPGRGKTHLMVGSLRRATRIGKVATWRNMLSFVSEVQSTYSSDTTETRAKILNTIFNHEIVFLDDLGKERKSEDVDGILYEMIDGLYLRRRTLVVSTNLEPQQLKSRYDPATLSRFKQMTTILRVEGRDRREDARYG